MSLVEQVKIEIENLANQRAKSAEYARLSEFNDEMQRLGLGRKQGYDLPLLDTIGRSIYGKTLGIKTGF